MGIRATEAQLAESARLEELLNRNNQRRFVKRILFPDKAPVAIDDEDPEGKRVMTHKMAWGEADGKYYVYPTVMEDPTTGQLHNYGNDAFTEAMRRKDYIQFLDPNEADWFSSAYKKYWDKIGYMPRMTP